MAAAKRCKTHRSAIVNTGATSNVWQFVLAAATTHSPQMAFSSARPYSWLKNNGEPVFTEYSSVRLTAESSFSFARGGSFLVSCRGHPALSNATSSSCGDASLTTAANRSTYRQRCLQKQTFHICTLYPHLDLQRDTTAASSRTTDQKPCPETSCRHRARRNSPSTLVCACDEVCSPYSYLNFEN